MGENKGKTGQDAKRSQGEIALRPGPRVMHGGYSFIRTGKIPKKKARIERYLSWVRMIYIEDIAGTEDKMTAGQTVLLNKLILLEGLCRCIETTTAEVTEETGRLYNMPKNYSTYVNLILKICAMLGIEKRELADDTPDIQDYIKATYGKKKKR